MKANDPKDKSAKLAQEGTTFKDLEPSLDVHQAARLLNICTKKVNKLCHDGELPHHWIGNKRLFRPEDIRDFWARRTIDGSKPIRVDSSDIKDERRTIVRKGSDADGVTLEEIRALCRR